MAVRLGMRTVIIVGAAALCFVGPARASDRICPPSHRLAGDADELRMEEDEFNMDYAFESLRYYREDVPRMLRDVERMAGNRARGASFSSYPNGLTIIEGSLLRQEAMRRRSERDLALATQPRGSAAAKHAADRFEQARKQFCGFLKAARYVD